MMTLWILFCRMPDRMDTLFTFYARDGDDAERQAREILAESGYRWVDLKAYPGQVGKAFSVQKAGGYRWVDLKAYPGGFVIHRAHIAGMMEVPDKE